MNKLLVSRRTAFGLALLLASLMAAAAAVLVGSANTSLGPDPEMQKFSIEFVLAAALPLGWALGAAVEGWVRGDSFEDWFEAFFFRFAGGAIVFWVIIAAVIALERAGVGPQNL